MARLRALLPPHGTASLLGNQAEGHERAGREHETSRPDSFRRPGNQAAPEGPGMTTLRKVTTQVPGVPVKFEIPGGLYTLAELAGLLAQAEEQADRYEARE